MNVNPRRVAIAVLSASLLASRAFSQNTNVPRVTLTPGLSGAPGASILAPGLSGGALNGLSLLPTNALTPSFGAYAAPSIQPVAFAANALAVPGALSPVHSAAAKPAAPGKTAVSPAQKVAPALEALDLAAAGKHSKNRGGGKRGGWQSLEEFYDGARGQAAKPVVPDQPSTEAKPKGFQKNRDGVWVGGRVLGQSQWIDKMYAELSPTIDLEDVMDVMDDAYDEVRVKLHFAAKAAQDRQLEESSVHLEGTRNWVDAVLTDVDGSEIAVHTHRVYFHPGRGNAASEIAEGIRRVGKYLDKAKADFAKGGLAETDLERSFEKVQLNFDTRGYKEIADYIKSREKEFDSSRFQFDYLTEPAMKSADLRAEYNRLVVQFREQEDGLMNIIDGVTYSRTVGVGHELNSHKQRIAAGLKITQAGRDFFGPNGYITEFDALTEGPEGVTLWEDKSTRVWMPLEKTMEETFLYKLRIYRDNRKLIEDSTGGPLKVVFSVDVGGTSRIAAKKGLLVWVDERQKILLEHLRKVGPELSKEFGFPVSFVFANSHPDEPADLYERPETSLEEWQSIQAALKGGRREARKGGNGRKHGRGRR